MRLIIEAGTDVAAVAVGDPSRLEQLRTCCGSKQCKAALDAAVANGSLWRTDTGSDGAFLFHVFVNESPPAAIAGMLEDPQTIERFDVPSGRLLVAGEEAFVGAPDIAKHSHMGREVDVPPGAYVLTASRVEAPEGHLDQQFAAVAPPDEQRAWRIGSAAPGWCFVGLLVALVAAYFIYIGTVSIVFTALPIAAVAIAVAWAMWFRRQQSYEKAEQRFRTVEREMPSIVVVMHSSS